MAKVVILASNYGLWAEELQAPWDALTNAGHDLTLATYKGMTPLPINVSVDPAFIDPMQHYPMNPQEVVDRVNALLDSGAWDHSIKFTDIKMSDYDAIVIVGGPGAGLDITGNLIVHGILLEAYKTHKLIGGICYGNTALALTRDPDNGYKSIIYNKNVTAHPDAWDFNFDLPYTLVRTTPENKGTDLLTPGFVYPLEYIVKDAVGDYNKVIADPSANRENPKVCWDKPFVTGLSVESSILFGKTLVEVLATEYAN